MLILHVPRLCVCVCVQIVHFLIIGIAELFHDHRTQGKNWCSLFVQFWSFVMKWSIIIMTALSWWWFASTTRTSVCVSLCIYDNVFWVSPFIRLRRRRPHCRHHHHHHHCRHWRVLCLCVSYESGVVAQLILNRLNTSEWVCPSMRAR